MPMRKKIEGTPYQIIDERLSSLCKLYRDGEEDHFAQFYVQTGLLGECIVKGLDSPNLPFKERRQIHEAMWKYLHEVMGYQFAALQRVKKKNSKQVVTTSRKSLKRYK